MKPELIKMLQQLAAQAKNLDPEDPWSCTADLGNLDDAYWGGVEDGKTELARLLLSKM